MNEAPVKNRLYTVSITGYSSEGFGVARVGDFVVFVSGGASGDICEIKITKTGKNAAFAIINRIITPSKDRIKNDCPAYPRCGGCDLRHISYEAELVMKISRVKDSMKRIGGFEIEPEVVLSAQMLSGYRNKAVFPVGISDGRPCVGFFRSRSHDIIPLQNCPIAAPYANSLMSAVVSYMEESGVAPYDEINKTGTVRNIYVRTGVKQALLCLSCVKMPENTELLIQKACAAADISAVVININPFEGNVLFKGEFIPLFGDGIVTDTLDGLCFDISPRSFYQINREMTAKLYALATDFAGLMGNETVLDLYCGIGTITSYMAKKAKFAFGAEIVPDAVENARAASSKNGLHNIEFICADAYEAAKTLAGRGVKPDVVTVDPPRKGLEKELIETITEMSPDRIVYVSCDPATLARDVKLFAAQGYLPTRSGIVDMFPRTVHVETVVLLSRVDSKGAVTSGEV